jgi:hypothetical protein
MPKHPLEVKLLKIKSQNPYPFRQHVLWAGEPQPQKPQYFASPCKNAPGEFHTLFVRLSCRSCARLQATIEKQLNHYPYYYLATANEHTEGQQKYSISLKYFIIFPNLKIPYDIYWFAQMW